MRRRGWVAAATAAGVTAAAVLVGALVCGAAHCPGAGGQARARADAVAPSSVPVAPSAAAGSAPAHPDLDAFRSTRGVAGVASPVRLRIPSIGVSSGLERLARAPDRSIEVPRDPASAGWWSGGPLPGQAGPAVVLGHVDSQRAPAVFYRLRELRPGSLVVVDRADGSAASFRVTRLARYPKDRFPSELVYYPTLHSDLRLVTCGGTFDPRTGHYRDNVIAFATLAT